MKKKNDIVEFENKKIKRRVFQGRWYYNINDILKAINKTKDTYLEEIINSLKNINNELSKQIQKIINIDNEDFGNKETIIELIKKYSNKDNEDFEIWFTRLGSKIYIQKTPLEKYHRKIENLKKGLKRKTKGSNNYKKEKAKINNYKKHNKRNGGK